MQDREPKFKRFFAPGCGPSPNATMRFRTFYISYNDRDHAVYGGVTTAIVEGQMDHFYILNGDHREKLKEAMRGITLGEGINSDQAKLAACLEYFNKNIDQANFMSEVPRYKSLDEITGEVPNNDLRDKWHEATKYEELPSSGIPVWTWDSHEWSAESENPETHFGFVEIGVVEKEFSDKTFVWRNTEGTVITPKKWGYIQKPNPPYLFLRDPSERNMLLQKEDPEEALELEKFSSDLEDTKIWARFMQSHTNNRCRNIYISCSGGGVLKWDESKEDFEFSSPGMMKYMRPEITPLICCKIGNSDYLFDSPNALLKALEATIGKDIRIAALVFYKERRKK